MYEYLVRGNKKMFSRMVVQQFVVMFELLENLSFRDKDYLASLYKRNAENFEQTFDVFAKLKLVTSVQGKVVISRKFSSILKEFRALQPHKKREWVSEYLINVLFCRKSEAKNEFIQYARNFHLVNDSFVYSPTNLDNIRYADIRNFLMDLELLEFDSAGKCYVFTRPVLLGEIEETQRDISKAALEQIQKSKKELGEKAELVALSHEQGRLSHLPRLVSQIKHVAKDIVNAGYDIESFSELTDRGYTKRYIEVKAVWRNSPRFYWSKNEIEKAKALGDMYWLYLVSYTSKQNLDSDNIEKICNPYQKLFLEKNGWEREVELYTFSK